MELDMVWTSWAPARGWLGVLTAAGVLLAGASARAWDPSEQTADLPDGWLVLYNLNVPDSVLWADWYVQQWDIPASNLLGLAASPSEHLNSRNTFRNQIQYPVRNFLDGNPELAERIIGIVVGYGVPGHFASMPQGGPGGYSVADHLQEPYSNDVGPSYPSTNLENPHVLGQMLPNERLTRASLPAGKYLVARIDAPTLDGAMALTRRAKRFGDPNSRLPGQTICYDYYDPDLPVPGHEWTPLRQAVESPELADLPWVKFDMDGVDGVPVPGFAAFRFAVYKLYGWSKADFGVDLLATRVLAWDLNSYGATTVRSTSAPGGDVFVPNALNAGYAAAIGATGEPYTPISPYPDTLLAALREGWTLGEAYHLADPFERWVWTLVGDPLMTLPHWFDVPEPIPGDVNGDQVVNLADFAGFLACMGGPDVSVNEACAPFDFDPDGDYDLADLAGFQVSFTGGPVVPRTADADGDGRVTLEDYGQYADCVTPPGPIGLDPTCQVFDLDFDLDVDMQDFLGFQALFDPVDAASAGTQPGVAGQGGSGVATPRPPRRPALSTQNSR